MKKIIKGVKTSSGIPALWEYGGYGIYDGIEKGKARLIAYPDGSLPTALFINLGTEEANGNHALVAVYRDCLVIDADFNNDCLMLNLYVVEDVNVDGDEVNICVSTVNRCCNRIWEKNLPKNWEQFTRSADDKVRTLNCRKPFYVCYPRKIAR